MSRNTAVFITPYEAERRAIAELARIGAMIGRATDWKEKPYDADDIPMGFKRPYKRHGKKRGGQHRGHRCSQTSASGKKKS